MCRILGGKAMTKNNGNSYFYYYCNDCKLTIKEKDKFKGIGEAYISKVFNLEEYDLEWKKAEMPWIIKNLINWNMWWIKIYIWGYFN